MVEELEVADDGEVSMTFCLGRDDPAQLVRQVRSTVRDLEGVTDLRLRIVEPPGQQSAGPAPKSAAHPGPGPATQENLGTVLAVSSGKGGVGKSTVTTNLAVALAREGARVGLMDADVYGPNVPRMMGINEKPKVQGQKITPLEAHGVSFISLGLLVERDAPAIWRGPIVTKIIQQFLRDVDWGQLDFLLVDLPPGTGDAQLSLVQSVHVQSALIVTTPQLMATGDGLRGAKMFDKVGVRVTGIIENMSHFVCPHCGERSEIFESGGGAKLAEELGVPLLGQVPLQANMTELADQGQPIVVADPDSPASEALISVARAVREKSKKESTSLPVITG